MTLSLEKHPVEMLIGHLIQTNKNYSLTRDYFLHRQWVIYASPLTVSHFFYMFLSNVVQHSAAGGRENDEIEQWDR